MNSLRIFKVFFLLLFLSSCYSKDALIVDEKDKDYVKVDYSLVLADYNKSQTSDVSICGMTDTSVETSFNIVDILRGNIKNVNNEIRIISCEHWSDEPFLEPQYSGMPESYKYKWLLLFVNKGGTNKLVEKEAVFYLKDNKTMAFCSRSPLIQRMLRIENKYLGEVVGSKYKLELNSSKSFFEKSPCHTVKGKYAYLDQGVILDIEKFKR